MSQALIPSLMWIAISIAAGVGGQTVIKLGVQKMGTGNLLSNGLLSLPFLVVNSPLILLGLLLYAAGAFAWIIVLSRLDLSYAYPFLTMNLVLITFVSWWVLDESIPMMRWLGIGLICLGVFLVARSALS